MRRRASAVLRRFAAVAMGAIALLAVARANMDLLGDSFWSIAVGRVILATGALPARDPFAFTTEGVPWVVHMPLCQVLFAALADGLGLKALAFAMALTEAAALSIVWLPHARAPAVRALTWSLLVGAMLAHAGELSVRGQIFGDLGFALLLLCATRLTDGRNVPAVVPLAMGAVWIALHASVFLAVVLPLALAVAALAAGPRDHRSARAAALARFAGLVALGLLVNPYGPRLPIDLLRLLTLPSTRALDLFTPLDLGDLPALMGALAVVVTLLVSGRRDPLAADRPHRVTLVGVLVAACASRRYLPLAEMYALVLLARALERAPGPLVHARAAGLAPGALGAVATVVAVAFAPRSPAPLGNVPVDAAEIIAAALPDRVFNLYHWGGYLDYAWGGRRKVFIDGRNQLFDAGGVFADYRRVERIMPDFRDVLRRHGIGTVLWEQGTPLDAALARDPAWRLVHRKGFAVIYVRRALVGSR